MNSTIIDFFIVRILHLEHIFNITDIKKQLGNKK